MARTSNKRNRLIASAKTLIHRQGLNRTTLADISRDAQVPLGNVYYYFKTKDDLAAAVIAERLENLEQNICDWENKSNPADRLLAFVERFARMRESLSANGCPVGSLCQELNKERNELARLADRLLQTQLSWATRQFRLLGCSDAVGLAEYFIGAIQGACILAHANQDPTVIDRRASSLRAWLRDTRCSSV